jgi:energy-coupling factor transport system ATP-binding protein
MLQVKDLSVRYLNGKEKALSSINLEAKEGEFIVIAGNSGSGKSTLAQILMTLIPNFIDAKISGNIFYNDTHFKDLSREKLVKMLGYVPQYPSDFTTSLLVEEEIVFLLENLALDSDKIYQRLNNVLAELEIETLQNRVVPELSSGELQRVFLASALAYTPPIIILDEPIARIDPKTEIKLVKKLRDLADQGHLIIAFEHRLDYILNEADRLIILDKGKIITDGIPSDHLKNLKEIDPPELSLLDIGQDLKLTTLYDIPNFKNIVSRIENKEIPRTKKKKKLDIRETVVRLNQINFRYNKRTDWILENVNLQLGKGESIGLVGINGSGKSTMMKIILGIEKTVKGEVEIKNRRIRRTRRSKQDCTYVPENAKLFLIGPTPFKDLEKQLKNKEEVSQLYQKYKMSRLMNRKLYHLSEGERRLFSLINSFQFDDDIILLDEPTIALDKKGREILLSLIEENKKRGKTIVLASNDPRIITTLDRIIVIKDGKITLDGCPREVLYELEKQTDLVPNQTVRFIQKLEEQTGKNLPRVLNPSEFNSLFQERK